MPDSSTINLPPCQARSDPAFLASVSTDDIAEGVRIFREHGLCIFPEALSRDVVRQIRERLFGDMQRDEETGTLYHGSPGSDFDSKSTRIADLPNKGGLFLDLLDNEIFDTFRLAFLGRGGMVSSFTANIPQPGATGMGWHSDQGYVPRPWPPYPFAINVLWTIDNSTIDNGATWIVPGSHTFDHGPSLTGTYDAVAVEAPPGSIYVMDGRMWHRTGINRTLDETRTVLISYLCRGFIRPQVNWAEALKPEIRAGLNDRLKEIFGLSYNPANDITVWDDRNPGAFG